MTQPTNHLDISRVVEEAGAWTDPDIEQLYDSLCALRATARLVGDERTSRVLTTIYDQVASEMLSAAYAQLPD